MELGFDLLALIGGIIQIPGVDAGINRFLAPTFANSRLAQIDPTTGTSWEGLIIGALVSVLGIGIAYRIYVLKPGTSTRLRERFSAVYTLLSEAPSSFFAVLYCTSSKHFAAVNSVYTRYFPDNPPARIFVCIPEWTGPFDIEIDCVALM